VVPAADSLTFYRSVRNNPPIERDFWPKQREGEEMRPPLTAKRERLRAGVSLYGTIEAA